MRYKDFAAFFNPFVSHTVKFLNRFACVCEEVFFFIAVYPHSYFTFLLILYCFILYCLYYIDLLENIIVFSTWS